MNKELVAAISKLTSELYEFDGRHEEIIEPSDVTPKNAVHKYHPDGLYEVGTVIPWLDGAVWRGNARSFANFCFGHGEPQLVRNSSGVILDRGSWLEGYRVVNPIFVNNDEMPSQLRPRNLEGCPAFPFPRN